MTTRQQDILGLDFSARAQSVRPQGPGTAAIAQGKRRAEILIYEDIGGDIFGGLGAREFSDRLNALGKIDVLNVRINSVGGSVFEGMTIYNTISRHPARVEVDIDGIAASIASLIAMAGDEIRIAESGFMMVHRAMGPAFGSSVEMRELADRLEKIDGALIDAYVRRSGLDVARVTELVDSETWMDAREAVDLGFADGFSDPSAIAAHAPVEIPVLKLDRFERVPDSLKALKNDAGRRVKIAAMAERLRALGLTGAGTAP